MTGGGTDGRDPAPPDPAGGRYRGSMGHPSDRPADIERLAELLDDRFRMPLTGWRFGLDGLIGLIPGAGDLITAALSVYIIYRARRLGVPLRIRARMAANVALDLFLGAAPVAGDLFDFAWKANRRNLRLIEEHLDASAVSDAGGATPAR